MIKSVLIPFAAVLLLALAGCQAGPAAEPPPVNQTQPAQPGGALYPTKPAAPADCAYPSQAGLCLMPTAPSPAVDGAYPAGNGAGLLEQTAPAGGAAFRDCARTPGISGCDVRGAVLTGQLAFYEAQSGRLIGVDLHTGAGWQAARPAGAAHPAGAPLEGAPRLLDAGGNPPELLVDLGGDQYALYRAGKLVETFQSEAVPRWQPDGSLSRDGTLQSQDGWSAGLHTEDGAAWELRARDPQGQAFILPLDSSAPDTLFSLRGFAPGLPVLLMQRYTAGNAVMLSGAQVLLLDARSGETAALEAFAPLDDGAFAWDPSARDAARLAFISGAGPDGGQKVALLSFSTLDRLEASRFPLPNGVLLGGLAWRPDGQRIALTVSGLAQDAPEAARKAFPTPGIYLLDPAEGVIEPFVQTPSGAQDGWAHWSGGTLIYARAVPAAGSLLVQARARTADGQDWALVDGLPVDETVAGQVVWQRVLAFSGE